MYKPVLISKIQDIKQIRAMSLESRKSKELWDLFSKSLACVPEDKFVLSSRQIDFITLIRSVHDNRMITYGNNSMCTVRTCTPVEDPDTKLDDLCIINAYQAFTQTIKIVNPDKESMLFNFSMPQPMGILNYHNTLSVYLNIYVDETIINLLDTEDAILCNGAQFVPINSFKPVKGSREELIQDSLVIVKGDTHEG